MLSKDIRDMFADFEARDPDAKKQRTLQGLFIDIALAITRMRVGRGLSQRDLAHKLHTSHPTIARWESPGYTGYTMSKLVELADALEHTVELRFVPKKAVHTSTEEAPESEWNELDLIRNKASWVVQQPHHWAGHAISK